MAQRDPDLTLTRRRLVGLGLAAAGVHALGPLPSAIGAASRPRAASLALRLPYARRIGPVRVPGGLELAGLRWPGHAHVDARLRARRAGGRWSPWLTLGHADDHGPDARGVAGTDPAWTGPADEVELRLSRAVHGLSLHTVRTRGARRSFSQSRARAAQAGAPPPIILRHDWGGDSCPPRTGPAYGQVQVAFVHHTVNGNDYQPQDSAAIVLAICHYHRDTNKWNDLGYNFLVDKYGQIFEGRAGGIDQAIVGAQAQGYNSASTGIANIGTYEAVAQSPEAMDAMARLIAWKLPLHGVPVTGEVTLSSGGGETNRYPAGTPVTFQRISGHRDGDKTACPGAALYAQLPDLRNRTAAIAPAVAPAGQLTLSAVTDRLIAPEAASLLGQLRDANGQPVAGQEVSVQIEGKTAWSPLSKAVTGADGTFTAQVALSRNARLRARFAPSYGAVLTSAPVTFTVVPAVTARATRRVRAGSVVTVSVAVSPRRTRVVLDVSRQVAGGRYVRVGSVRARVSAGRGTARIRLRRAGLYRIIARAPGDAYAAEGRAPWLFVRAIHGR